MVKPIAVLISDIHFTPSTLELASEAVKKAQLEALTYNVPLIIAGDTLDTKAIIRAECANRLIELFSSCAVETYVMVGNHDLLNEKGKEHSLHFLSQYVNIVAYPVKIDTTPPVFLIPYQANLEDLKAYITSVPPKGSTLIMHQGVMGADMGHYVQDRTSLSKDMFSDFRVISGHYHKRQDIKCGRPKKGAIGLFSYIGNPYTLSFGEAKDPEKGFQILNSDGILTFVPTNLRKHIIEERDVNDLLRPLEGARIDDLIWVKVRGTRSQLSGLKKAIIGKNLLGHENFKLDLIPLEGDVIVKDSELSNNNPVELMDKAIEGIPETEEHIAYLKNLWREVLSET